jgi:hypothetical protein
MLSPANSLIPAQAHTLSCEHGGRCPLMLAQSRVVHSCVRGPPSLGRRPCTGVGGGCSVRPVGAGLGAVNVNSRCFAVHVWNKLNRRGSTAICPVSCRAYTGSVISSWKDHGPYCSNIESNKNRKKYAKDLLVRIRCAKHMNLLAAPFEQISAKTVLLGESAPTWCDNELCTLHDQVLRSIKSYRQVLDRGIEANDSLFHGDFGYLSQNFKIKLDRFRTGKNHCKWFLSRT